MELSHMDQRKIRSKLSWTFRDMYSDVQDVATYNIFKLVTQTMVDVILEYILDKSDGFIMPYGLGFIQIGKYKPATMTPKSLSKDYKASKDYNKNIYHLNEHSDGYKYRLYWSRIPQTFPDRYKYQLNLIRANKRKLAQMIFNKHDYLNINDIQLYKM